MNDTQKVKLENYWSDIPIGREHAVSYATLVKKWNACERKVRHILHELSLFDNGDDYILVRSGSGKGFYRTDDKNIIESYKKECLNKGKSVFAPVKKINRVLNANDRQYSYDNNLRLQREANLLKQSDVCKIMRKFDKQFDKSLLSKMENGVCLPTPLQLAKLSEIYMCDVDSLINVDLL